MAARDARATLPGGGMVSGPTRVPIIAIGASAGGIEALRRFFGAAPTDGGAGYVVILHLDPDRQSRIDQILERTTTMPVEQVAEDTAIQPDRIYVIPPKKQLEVHDGTVRVSPLSQETPRLTIDRFFRSLAASRRSEAVGVVLSGSGRDGALGLRAIREQGGITATQDPADAEFPEMPRSAADEGRADLVLAADELPVALLRILAAHDGGPDPSTPDGLSREGESAVEGILAHLEEDTGHSFRPYKRTTILRRLDRRMRFCRIGTLPEYSRRIEADGKERRELFQDLLISVSQFFRDPQAYQTLEVEVIPRLFQGRDGSDQVRAWVPGCATGEEAYSVAMLLHEHAAAVRTPPEIRVFATDIDERALAFARRGHYPISVAEDIAPERLERFFENEKSGYQVLRRLRESVLFAPHGLLVDPPFPRLDLISCRNVLIYLEAQAQREALERCHYVLRPRGFLFLGPSESAPPDLFEPVAKRHRIYRRGPGRGSIASSRRGQVRDGFAAWRTGTPSRPGMRQRRPGQSVHERLLLELVPPSAVVDSHHQVVHLSEGVGRYLRHPVGSPTADVRDLALEPIATHLQTALYQTFRTGEVSRRELVLELGEGERIVELIVRPGSGDAEGLAVVTFQERAPAWEPEDDASGTAARAPLREMEEELRRTRDQLRVEIEEREALVEEFTAANEELQSVSEEHQATSEELEIRGEELQSVNEELTTLNQEHRETIGELAELNSHLTSLIEATRIAIVFLDPDLRVRRFTVTATHLFNLVASDQGRPFGHITHRLQYDGDMLADAQRALETETRVEAEARSTDRSYLVRFLPYRSVDDATEGLAIIFVDITERRASELEAIEARRRAEEEKARVSALVEQMPAGVLIVDCESREAVITNRRAREVLSLAEGVEKPEAAEEEDVPRDAPTLPPFLVELVDQVIETGKPVLNRRMALPGEGPIQELLVSAAMVAGPDEAEEECIFTLVDIEEILAHARSLEEHAEKTKVGFLATISHEFRTPLNAIAGYTALLLEGLPDALTEAQERHVRRVRACADQLAGMVEQILTLTHLVEGGTPVSPESLDPRDPIKVAASLIEPEARQRGLALRMELPDEMSPIVTDPERLRQLLVNLAHNAVKYTREGEVVLAVREGPEGGAVLEVRDTGVGIAPEDQERIFERFWQARRAERPVGTQGTGIGLSVARSLAELLGGTIEVESEVGEGSTFRVRLPARLEGYP